MRAMRGAAVTVLLVAAVAHADPWVVRRETRWLDAIDAYLWQSSPDSNSGSSSVFYTGLVGAGEKTALIRFDVSFVPRGAQVTRARVFLDVQSDGAVPIRVHAVTVPWQESKVTWNNFDAGFEPAVQTSFLPADGSFDVTALVHQWVNGRRNDGLYLEQMPNTSPSVFSSSNEDGVALRPRLELEFTPARPIETEVLSPVGDAYIWSANPGLNYCCTGYDTAGNYSGGDKVALLQFDVGSLPKDTTVVSATLRLRHDPGHPVNRNRVWPAANPWAEATVTWASYGAVPAGEAEIVFPPTNDGGHTEVEVRSIVQPWVEGAPNHGFLVDQGGAAATWWYSREAMAGLRPELRLRFVRTVPDGGVVLSDGGIGFPDAGTGGPGGGRFFGVGCGAAPGGLALWLLLGFSVRRRPTRSR